MKGRTLSKTLLAGAMMLLVLVSIPSVTALADVPYEDLLNSPQNMVKNPAFQAGLDSWNIWGPGGTFAWFVDDAGLFGGKAVSIAGGQDYDLVYQRIYNLEPGKKYYAFAWVKTSIRAKDCFARLTIAAYDQADQVIQYEYSREDGVPNSGGQTGVTGWQLHRVVYVPAKNVAYITIQGTSLGTWELDDQAWWTGFVFLPEEAVPAELKGPLVYSNEN